MHLLIAVNILQKPYFEDKLYFLSEPYHVRFSNLSIKHRKKQCKSTQI